MNSTLLSNVGVMPSENIVSFHHHQKKPISRGIPLQHWRWYHSTKCAGELTVNILVFLILYLSDILIDLNVSCMLIMKVSMVKMLHGHAKNIKVTVSFQRLFLLHLISQMLYLLNSILLIIFTLKFLLNWFQARRRALLHGEYT